MAGILTIAKKEFTDHVSDSTFLLIFTILLIVMVAGALYQVESLQNYRYNVKYPAWMLDTYMLQLLITYQLSSLGALLALAISFNSINKERIEGNLKVLLSYPIYRDKIILGKLLGGVAAITVSIITSTAIAFSIVIYELSLPISVDLLLRIAAVVGMGIVLLTFFLCLGTAVSTTIRDTSTSLLILLIALGLMQGEPLAMMLVMISSLAPQFFKAADFLSLQYGANWLRWGTASTPTDIFTYQGYAWLSPVESYRHLCENLFRFWTNPRFPLDSSPVTFLEQLSSSVGLAATPVLFTVATFILCYVLFTRRDIA